MFALICVDKSTTLNPKDYSRDGRYESTSYSCIYLFKSLPYLKNKNKILACDDDKVQLLVVNEMHNQMVLFCFVVYLFANHWCI